MTYVVLLRPSCERDRYMSTSLPIYKDTRFQAVTGTYARSTPEALEDAVNRLAEPRGNVIKFKRKAS